MASIKLRRGSGVPSGLTFGEPAFDITNSRLYIGITGSSVMVGVAGGGVHSFNGLTGAVTGVTTGSANVFGPLQSFTNGISSAGGTFSSQVNFVSGISASGGTFNNDIFVNSVRVGRGSGSIVSNVAVGANALNSNTTGTVNTAVGQQALQGNISGSNNTGIGRRSLLGLTTGDQNSALGTSSLVTLANGNKCLGLGAFSGQSLSLGTGSIYIGSGSDSSSNTTVNEIVIGTDTVGLGSNTTVIGPTTQVSATIRGLLNAPNGISAAGGTFSGTLNIPSGSTLSVLGRIVGNVVNTIHGFTGGVTFAGVNGITVDTSGAIGSAGRVNIGIQTSGSTSSTSAFSFLMKTGSTSGNVTTLSNTSDLIYYHPQSSLPVTLVGATGITIRGGGGTSFLASSDINQLYLPSRILGASISSLNKILTIQDGQAAAILGATTGIRLYSGDGSLNEYTATVYAKTLSTNRTYELPDASGTFALTEATQTFTAPQSFTSGISASGGATFASNVAVNGGSLTTTATTGNLFNTTATTLNIGGAATTTNIANFAGGLTLNIATGTNAASVKNINIGTGNVGGGSTRLTISDGSGLIQSSSNGITMGSISGGVISSLSRFVASSGICSGGNINLYGAQPIIASAGTSNIIIAPGSGTLGVSGGVCAGAFILTSSGIKALTGTTYTFLDSDNGDILTHDNASGCTFTVPTNLPVGFSTTVIRLNANGRVGFTAAAGVVLNSYLGLTGMAGQHASASLISYANNTFNLAGALA